MVGETSFPNLLTQWVMDGFVKITENEVNFWNGSIIQLKHCADDVVMSKHQGNPSHVRTWGESTQIPVHRINFLNKWVSMSVEMQNRVPEKWKGTLPRIYYPTNPIGQSVPYFKRNFVDFGAMTIHEHGNFKRQYIPILVTDNPHEDAEATKARWSEEDPAVADAMLNANWNALVGEFFPEWDVNRHVVSDFWPPPHWFRFRSFDWGMAEPFAVYWIAVSDGEVFRDECGKERWFPRGAYIFYNEWYGCDKRDPSKGIRMRNTDIALGILERSDKRDVITLTDSKPFQDTGGDGPALEFARAGVVLTHADTARVAGWSQMRSRMIGQKQGLSEKRIPMIYFCARCAYAQQYIPALPRHKSDTKREDAAEHGEATHCCDCLPAGTRITTDQGDIEIQNIRVDQMVLTREGLKPVETVFSVGLRDTFKIQLSDGSYLVATGTHKIWSGGEFKQVQDLRYGDMVYSCKSTQTNIAQELENYEGRRLGLFLRAIRYTTKMAIHPIMIWKTFSAYLPKNMRRFIDGLRRSLNDTALNAVAFMNVWNAQTGRATAPMPASPPGGERARSTTPRDSVSVAEEHSGSINTQNKDSAGQSARVADGTLGRCAKSHVEGAKGQCRHEPTTESTARLHVVNVTTDRHQRVYNLTVADKHEYFANGILVANSIRYATMAHTVIKDKLEPVESRIQREIDRTLNQNMKNWTKDLGLNIF